MFPGSDISVPAKGDSFIRLPATRFTSFLCHRAVWTTLHWHSRKKTALLFLVSSTWTSVLLRHHVENDTRGLHEASNVVSLDRKTNFTYLCILFDCILCNVWINVAFPSNYATELVAWFDSVELNSTLSNKISSDVAFPWNKIGRIKCDGTSTYELGLN